MQFHHHGYVSTDPRFSPAAATGLYRPTEVPDQVDVLIVGSGPAGMLLAAQLAQFPTIVTRLVERRSGRLAIGQADGIQARSVETFQAFGFAEQIIQEAYQITEMNFWTPDRSDPRKIIRTQRTTDDENQISEFPHLIVNQARVLDYFAAVAERSPSRLVPDYGVSFVGLEIADEGEFPVAVTLRTVGGDGNGVENEGIERMIHAKYVVGCDGARSRVREAIGRQHLGDSAAHAWGVMDVLGITDFPDIRTKCAIQSRAGSILHIPREGGYLFRMYVDLGEVPETDHVAVRQTPLATIIEKANAILHPYTLDVVDVPWWSVYEVGHRVTDKFDDVDVGVAAEPRVFIAGDACHTHSAKAGQGMNVSMQDGFNLGWKLGAVLTGRSPVSLLSTYSAERQVIAQNLIDFDKEWSSLMAKSPAEIDDPAALGDFYVATAEFPAGFMTQYPPSLLIGEPTHQALAVGFPIGKRFKSAPVVRVADTNPVQLGHHHRADGRWRIYAFADATGAQLEAWAVWLAEAPESPLLRYTPSGTDPDSVFDVKVIYQQSHHDFDVSDVRPVFLPRSGPLGLVDYEKVYAAGRDGVGTFGERDIFEERGIDRTTGAVIVVRPDQYVATVLPLSGTEGLATFFDPIMLG